MLYSVSWEIHAECVAVNGMSWGSTVINLIGQIAI